MATTDTLVEATLAFIESELIKINPENDFRCKVEKVSRVLESPEEMDDGDYPALFITWKTGNFLAKNNREIELDMLLSIVGYVKFNEMSSEDDNAQQKLIKLMADVTEKMYALWLTSGFSNNTVDNFDIVSFATDEGTLEPLAVFELEMSLKLKFSPQDWGRKIN